MKGEYDVPDLVPTIRNIADIGEKPEPIAFVHFTGKQWREAIRGVRFLRDENQLPVKCPSTGGLRFMRLGGSRGDVLVSAEQPACLGSPGERVETVCIMIPISEGFTLRFECHCFERPVRNGDGGNGESAGTCRVGFQLDNGLEARCVSDNCENCVGPLGWATDYWSGQLTCFCSDQFANLGG